MSTEAHARDILQSRWRSRNSPTFFAPQVIPEEIERLLPRDYLSLVRDFGGKEGFLGTMYLRLYRFEDVMSANHAYEVPTLFPECFVFGSNGGGEALALELENGRILRVPYIPLSKEYAEYLAASFSNFLEQLDASGESVDANPKTAGMEIHEIHPIVFGGDPSDEKNKALIPPAQHAEFARFWNKLFRNARRTY